MVETNYSLAKKLNIGQWIDAFEGIGQLLSLHEFFVEEYSEQVVSGKQVGEPLVTLAVYKMLCNFDGKIRKRNLIRCCNAKMCEPISKESQAVVDDVRKTQPKEYSKYHNFIIKKPLHHPVDIWLKLLEEQLLYFENKISAINAKLVKSFTWLDFYEKLEKFGIYNYLNTMHGREYPRKSNVIITLHNDDYVVKNRRAMFVKVEGLIIER